MRAACVLIPSFTSFIAARIGVGNRMNFLVRPEQRRAFLLNAVTVRVEMKAQRLQQWRPKIKAQCVSSDAGPVEVLAQKQTVLEKPVEDLESSKLESKVSYSVEVNVAIVQSMKKNRGKLKRKIEAETKTSLSISKQKTGCYIVVEGTSDDAVKQATKRLQGLLEKEESKIGSVEEKTPGSLKAQWIPKAVRSLHTAAGAGITHLEKSKEIAPTTEESIEDNTEVVSGAIQVDKKLLRLIKGHKNEVKQRIEKETNTTIRFGTPFVVEGSSEESVQEALAEIQRIIEEGVNDSKFQYSHFISLPLSVHASLVKQLEAFQESVLASVPEVEEEPTVNPEEAADALPEEEPIAAASSSAQEEPTVITVEEATGTVADEEAIAAASFSAEEPAEMEVDDSQTVVELDDTAIATDEIFQRSVLSSLGMDPQGTRQKELVFQVESKEEDEVLNVHSTEEVAEEIAQATEQIAQATEQIAQAAEEIARSAEEIHQSAEEGGEKEMEVAASDPVEKLPEDVSGGSEENAETEETEEKTTELEPLVEVPLSTKKKGSGIEKSIFIKPSRFHLTVLMLKLWNDERVDKAREVLQKCLPKVVAALDGRSLVVSLTGLEIMKGSPGNTRVLFAKVTEADGEDRLSRACQVIIDEFVESGLVLGKDREQELKLHATVMNTSHRRSKSKYKNKGFDATEILAKFGDEGWGDYQISEAHLSERFNYDENDYYHCCGSIPFPGQAEGVVKDEKA